MNVLKSIVPVDNEEIGEVVGWEIDYSDKRQRLALNKELGIRLQCDKKGRDVGKWKMHPSAMYGTYRTVYLTNNLEESIIKAIAWCKAVHEERLLESQNWLEKYRKFCHQGEG